MPTKKMNWNRGLLIHGGVVLVFVILSATGVIVDHIHSQPELKVDVNGPSGTQEMHIAGAVASSSGIVLKYNKCPADLPEISNSRLYSPYGVTYFDLTESGAVDQSVMEFAYMNIHEKTSQFVGDIYLLYRRARGARILAIISLTCLCLCLALMLAFRITPSSIVSPSSPEGDLRWPKGLNALIVLSGGLMWLSVTMYSSMPSVFLPYLFREARDRCGIQFSDSLNGHSEMTSLGYYVRDHSTLNGTSISLYGLVAGGIILYSAVLFLLVNGRTVNIQGRLSAHQLRSLSWYSRLWSWQMTGVVFVLSIFSTFWTANLTRTRGYELNLFYWKIGSNVSQSTGLSQTGTLLDVIQGMLPVFAVSEAIIASTCYVWLIMLPVISFACTRPLVVLQKGVQDISMLLLIRALAAWVTVAPTTLSMLEKPECFMDPGVGENDWSWIYTLSAGESCNDAMFSMYTIIVLVPIIVMLYYVHFTGITRSQLAWVVTGIMGMAAICTNLLVIMARHQYSADVHIGACVVVVYMLTQSSAYRLLFDEDSHLALKPSEVLSDKVGPLLEDCLGRVFTYQLASKDLAGLKASSEEMHEIALLYRTVGHAIGKAKNIGQEGVE